MDIVNFIRSDYKTVFAFTGVNNIKNELLRHSALVVIDEDSNWLGVLTPEDVLKKQHTLVIDCLTQKPTLGTNHELYDALKLMKTERYGALPVFFDHGGFAGLVFKDELFDFVIKKRDKLLSEISSGSNVGLLSKLEHQRELLERIAWTQSHQTRQPVASILGLVSILDKTTLSSENKEIIEMLERVTTQLDNIIRETVLLTDISSQALD